jgi:isopentenyldiphosphate isomerase
MAEDELVPLVDGDGRTIGRARRSDVHGDPSLLHPVVHCLVENDRGELLLQLRSLLKDVQPGRWDTSVGGHVALDESIEAAVVREIGEELGVHVEHSRPIFLYRYVMRSEIETELVHSFWLQHNGPFRVEPEEIDELRFWTRAEIAAALGSRRFTPNFEDEFARFEQWRHRLDAGDD